MLCMKEEPIHKYLAPFAIRCVDDKVMHTYVLNIKILVAKSHIEFGMTKVFCHMRH